jgi:hypothetical protein
VPGLEGPVMGPDHNSLVKPAEGSEWLEAEEIQQLLMERDELRHEKKEKEAAYDVQHRLVSAGLELTEKTRGHVWGTWADQYGRCGAQEFTPPIPAEQHSEEHVVFCHDATRAFPPWVVHTEGGHHGIDLVVGNPPWGKNIGSKEDGLHIVQNLVSSFSTGYCTMALLVSKACFEATAELDKAVFAWSLIPGAFGVDVRVVAPETQSDVERVEKWALVHHAEIGQSVLMVMCWVNALDPMTGGMVYSSGYYGGRYNAGPSGSTDMVEEALDIEAPHVCD